MLFYWLFYGEGVLQWHFFQAWQHKQNKIVALPLVLYSCRHESSDNENLEQSGLLQVRVQNTKLGISTFWSLDKFQNNMAAMRELEQVCLKSVLLLESWLLDLILLFHLKTHDKNTQLSEDFSNGVLSWQGNNYAMCYLMMVILTKF